MAEKKASRKPRNTAKPATTKAAKKPTTTPDGRPAVEAWVGRVKPELQPLVRRLDRLILRAMPDAVCAVKWNVPFYGLTGQGWIAAVSSFKAHVKLVLFAGSALKPLLPTGKGHNAIDFRPEERFDEKQVMAWLNQAKTLPGWGRVGSVG
jgi:hypothetical protein